MSRAHFALLLGLAGFGAVLPIPAALAGQLPKPVVLELFTSNSCEKCPPADAFMRHLQKSPPPGIEPILLSEHVDYWNPYGWVDRYSKPQFTKRQRAYGWANFQGKIYTPQLIIDGRRSTVGFWKGDIRRAMQKLARGAKRPISIGLMPAKKQTLRLRIDFERAAADSVSQVWVALVQNNVVSKIGAGENAGRTLHEDGLVRTLTRAKAQDADKASARHYRTVLKLPVHVDRADLSVVAFAQRPTDYAIVAATRKSLP